MKNKRSYKKSPIKHIHDNEGNILTEEIKIIYRWWKYFEELLLTH